MQGASAQLACRTHIAYFIGKDRYVGLMPLGLCLLAVNSSNLLRLTLDDKTSKVAAVASDGDFWVSKVLESIARLETDSKHVEALTAVDDEDEETLRLKAKELIGRLKRVSELVNGSQVLSASVGPMADGIERRLRANGGSPPEAPSSCWLRLFFTDIARQTKTRMTKTTHSR